MLGYSSALPRSLVRSDFALYARVWRALRSSWELVTGQPIARLHSPNCSGVNCCRVGPASARCRSGRAVPTLETASQENLPRGMDKRRSVPRWIFPCLPREVEVLEIPAEVYGDQVWRQKDRAAEFHLPQRFRMGQSAVQWCPQAFRTTSVVEGNVTTQITVLISVA